MESDPFAIFERLEDYSDRDKYDQQAVLIEKLSEADKQSVKVGILSIVR